MPIIPRFLSPALTFLSKLFLYIQLLDFCFWVSSRYLWPNLAIRELHTSHLSYAKKVPFATVTHKSACCPQLGPGCDKQGLLHPSPSLLTSSPSALSSLLPRAAPYLGLSLQFHPYLPGACHCLSVT